MKKRMIPAGMLFLVMACGSNSTESSPESRKIVDVNMELEPIPPSEDSEPAADEGLELNNGQFDVGTPSYSLRFSTAASDAYTYNSEESGTSQGALSINADGWAAAQKPAPNVGRAISSSAAVQGTDTTRRFIRVADIRFRVKDVVRATLGIEDIVGAHDGWVTKTQLRSEPRGQSLIPVSEDSILEVSRYELVNTITLRVPNTELDSTLRQIGRWVDLFDHRNILADDIRMRMMANAMAVRRAKAHSLRVTNAIDDQGRKLKETLAAEEALQASDEKRDQGILNNLELADRVAFSTVTIDIHQRTLVRKEMIANERNIDGYQPSLWSRIGESLKDGWGLVELAITGLMSIWPIVLLLGGSLWLLWRNMGKRKATRSTPMVPPAPPVE